MDEFRLNLGSAGNTYNPALITLRDKGYHLRAEASGEAPSLWFAIKDGRRFVADTPPELLGLVALWEHLGDDWNRRSPDVLGEILEAQD